MNIIKITRNKFIHQKVNKFASSLLFFNDYIIFNILSFLKISIKNDYYPINEYFRCPGCLDFNINEYNIKVNWIEDDDGNRLELQRIKSKRGDYIFSEIDIPFVRRQRKRERYQREREEEVKKMTKIYEKRIIQVRKRIIQRKCNRELQSIKNKINEQKFWNTTF